MKLSKFDGKSSVVKYDVFYVKDESTIKKHPLGIVPETKASVSHLLMNIYR